MLQILITYGSVTMYRRMARLGRLTIFAGLFLATLSGLSAQAAKDPVIGKWVLDPVNSTFSGAVPEKRVLTFEVVGADAIKQIVDTTGANGATDRSEFTAKFDGKDVPITNSVLDFVSVKRISPTKVERSGKRRATKDEIVETQVRELSADGKTLTVTTNGTDFDGNEYSSTQVFKRMP
jgi:hypothetical protein